MDFLSHYGLFLAKSVTIVIAILIIAASIFSLRRKTQAKISIHSLSDEYRDTKDRLEKEIHSKKLPGRKLKKQFKQADKKKGNLYVIDFDGDIKASQADALRKAVTAVLAVAKEKDEVLIRLESPGGSVNGYGLAASQLQRVRDRKIPITVCIDKVAASGGYLMACVANTIIAAPFAIVGSIGVIAQLPNFNRWLKQHNIDVELITAGEYKRTLTIFGENTNKDRQKFQEDLEQIHEAFRDYVSENRQQINIDEVSTGEHWLALDAFKLRLIDKLQTSDDCIIDKMNNFKVWRLDVDTPSSLLDKLLKPAVKLLHPWA